ncbi:hypothetical protein DFS34DRAFT_612419 [Phlyctochytrium arcticum]|nr:hypothetical protein DFS34DRAFT_612419 [Phlyctochytrium arcticum]
MYFSVRFFFLVAMIVLTQGPKFVAACGKRRDVGAYPLDISHGYCFTSFDDASGRCAKLFGEDGKFYSTCVEGASRVHKQCLQQADHVQRSRLVLQI